jgi:release factor glutamine methyltransferase
MPAPDPAPAGPPPTVGSLLRELTAHLTRAGIEGAGGDARKLLAAALALSAADILCAPERPVTPAQAELLRSYSARRARREPVSRILGQRDFYGRAFTISPATLDPRPDSETLIAVTLELVREEGWTSAPLRILDLCTGSGCLLVTLLCELPQATGLGTDISAAALDVARDNARRLGVADRAQWLQADALEGVEGPFHMLVANPPYVRSAEIPGLDAEVRDCDPALALDGGADGLDMYRRFLPAVAGVVRQGWTVMEVGHDQAEAVAGLMAAQAAIDASRIRIHRDVAGKRRCVAARTLS